MKNKTQTGFTLYELLTTMLIVGVVLAIGVPNMQSFRQNSRMTAAANNLHSSFHLARSEAARSKSSITICASGDSMTATPTCGGELEAGWVRKNGEGGCHRLQNSGEEETARQSLQERLAGITRGHEQWHAPG